MSESSFRTKISKEFRRLGCLVIPLVGSAAAGAGFPDTYICSNYISFWIEFKGKNTVIRPVQVQMMRELKKRGDIVYVYREPGILQNEDDDPIIVLDKAIKVLQFVRETWPHRLKKTIYDSQ